MKTQSKNRLTSDENSLLCRLEQLVHNAHPILCISMSYEDILSFHLLFFFTTRQYEDFCNAIEFRQELDCLYDSEDVIDWINEIRSNKL